MTNTPNSAFDIIVVGGGHAGCEAAGRGGAHGGADGARHAPVRHHRRDVVQPGHRRAGQGPPGPRDRRPRRPDGPGGRRRRHPVPPAQPLPRSGGAGPARPGRPQALQGRHAGGDPGHCQPHRGRGRGRGPDRRGRRRRRHRHRRRPRNPGGRRGAHHRHVSARPHPPRRGEDPRRPPRRGSGQRPVAAAPRPGPPVGPAQDRHARPPRQALHRLGLPGHAAGRRRPGALLVPHQPASPTRRSSAASPPPPRPPTP